MIKPKKILAKFGSYELKIFHNTYEMKKCLQNIPSEKIKSLRKITFYWNDNTTSRWDYNSEHKYFSLNTSTSCQDIRTIDNVKYGSQMTFYIFTECHLLCLFKY